MSYLDKNINMALVIIVVTTVIIMLAITVFFQVGLKERTTDFEVTSENLTMCQTQLANYQSRLAQADEQLASTSEDIRRYDQLYESKVSELSTIEDQLDDAQSRVQSLRLINTGLESEVDQLESQRNELNQQVSQLNNRISQLEEDVDYWRDEYQACTNP